MHVPAGGHLNPYVLVVDALRATGGEVSLLLLSADGGALDGQRRRALGEAQVHGVRWSTRTHSTRGDEVSFSGLDRLDPDRRPSRSGRRHRCW
ncbi:hypothetical protein ACH495_10150 [Micromonospora sp. NPDC018662]|uniref:hypothetical protein n=1 Tax=Micromonospora sp. NPDC018662 TaxID=3364238 RepID=UPI00379DA40B